MVLLCGVISLNNPQYGKILIYVPLSSLRCLNTFLFPVVCHAESVSD